MIDVIVTGSEGFIGKQLVERLKKEGLSLLALNRSSGDVADPLTWASLPKARIVIHLAARSYVPDSWSQSADFIQVNVMGTKHCLDYCHRHHARLIFISTYVYGVPEQLPINENHPIHCNNPYALSKRLSEELCLFSSEFEQVETVILRLFNVFGPGQKRDFLIPMIMNQVRFGAEIRVKDLSPRRDYVYLMDVIEAIYLAVKTNVGSQVINIGSGISYSVKEVIDIIQTVMGSDLPVISDNEVRKNEIQNVVADIERARRVLDWLPRFQLIDGIREIKQFESACTL